MHKQPRWFWLVLWFLPLAAPAQDVFTLTADRLQNGQAVELDKLNWKYSPNDDPRFADPQFDDRAWETISNTAFDLDHLPKSGWQGIGWFRLRLRVDEVMVKEPLCLLMEHWGASEIWLDGRLLQRFGTVGATTQTEVEKNPRRSQMIPMAFVLDGQRDHLLAIRHSCAVLQENPRPLGRIRAGSSDEMLIRGREAGIRIALTTMATATSSRDTDIMFAYLFVIGTGTLYGVLGLLHVLLFVFYPPQRASLWFGLYALSFTGIQIGNFAQFIIRPGLSGMQYFLFNFLLTTILTLVSLLGFLYTVFGEGIGKKFWMIAAIAITARLAPFFFPDTRFFFWFNIIFLIGLVLEFARIVGRAIRRKLPGALYIGIPLLLLMYFPLDEALTGLGVYHYQGVVNLVFGIFFTLLATFAISTFLARQFAHTSRNLEEQLTQVQQLSAAALEHEKVKAEHDRKTKELEEARQLQLSMLPKKLPNLPHLDIAAYMKTASEVGGDYYDFHTSEDGTLTIAVGDATGHGLKAGTMVTAVKSLFDTLAYHPDIPHIFERLTRTLKRMNLRGLFMAMTVAKIKQHQLVVSVAGMPPVLLYRAALSQVEVIELKALPLGGVANYRYQQLTFDLAAGDAVVLLSDGLPERFNAQGEMLGEEPVQALLAQVGSQSAADIIAALLQAGEAWAGAHPQDDDVTLVVLKVK